MLFTKQGYGDEIRVEEMSEACDMHGGDAKCLQNFSGKS
jgi:hypothetical protein